MEFVNYSYGYIFKKTQKSFKCNNYANAKNSLCRKQWTICMRKQWIVLLNKKNKSYECYKSINEVTVLDDERDISDFSNSSNDDFQKFLPTNIRHCC